MKVCVVGAGYVGFSLAVLLSQKHKVVTLDISDEKIQLINQKQAPFGDKELQDFLEKKDLNLKGTLDKKEAYSDANYIIVSTPTNYDMQTGSFDTLTVSHAIADSVSFNPNAMVIIKSTVPIGFTDSMRKKYKKSDIIFSPEFLRENKALYDNLYPSRIVIGSYSDKAIQFGKMLIDCSLKSESQIELFNMESKEAEAVKLFSNAYLATRISFFNELDSFSEIHNLSSKKIIEGVSSDPRIGNYYNNPSFGYGGYCLPKDTKQLLENFKNIPNNIINAVVESNNTRKEFIVKSILNKNPKSVGIYRLIMKKGSDNYRESAVLDIIKKLMSKKVEIFLYEPLINESYFNEIEVISDIAQFLIRSDLIIANRLSKELDEVEHKVYSRDIFQVN
tara:strand:- start:32970 stop:34142 length:1173 start_codon:yes stop_codon:yes gene_type:complete